MRDGSQTCKTISEQDSEFTNIAQPGDQFSFCGKSGGGGGHKLIVNEFKVFIKKQEEP